MNGGYSVGEEREGKKESAGERRDECNLGVVLPFFLTWG